jgi:hypothetical protein
MHGALQRTANVTNQSEQERERAGDAVVIETGRECARARVAQRGGLRISVCCMEMAGNCKEAVVNEEVYQEVLILQPLAACMTSEDFKVYQCTSCMVVMDPIHVKGVKNICLNNYKALSLSIERVLALGVYPPSEKVTSGCTECLWILPNC